jgi:hypothetical protein
MQKNNLNYFFRISILTIVTSFFFVTNYFLPEAKGQQILDDQIISKLSTSTDPSQLLDTSIFKTDDQPIVLVKPTFNDSSTNIAFYMKCPSEACPNNGTLESPVYIFSAENLGHGTLPFSDYWAPPIASDYVAVEYKNDEQQFSCSGISLDNCLSDSHFISVFYFSLVENSTIITSEMLDEKKALNKQLQSSSTDTSIVSDALLQLSISFSSTSISSNLDNGLIVTATLDGVASIATSSVSTTDTTTSTETNVSTTTENDEDSTVGSFIMNIVDSIIDIFTPEETAVTEPATEEPTRSETEQSEPIQSETALPESTTPEPSPELPTVETPTSESTQENEVQSSISAEEIINNEIITTEF